MRTISNVNARHSGCSAHLHSLPHSACSSANQCARQPANKLIECRRGNLAHTSPCWGVRTSALPSRCRGKGRASRRGHRRSPADGDEGDLVCGPVSPASVFYTIGLSSEVFKCCAPAPRMMPRGTSRHAASTYPHFVSHMHIAAAPDAGVVDFYQTVYDRLRRRVTDRRVTILQTASANRPKL